MIKIDSREQELYSKCKFQIENNEKYKDLKLVSQNLHLGDIIINDGENECVIIERKTVNDLASSIRDGRYEEQSYRLNGLEHHNHNIIYLVEGNISNFTSFKNRVDKLSLYSSMVSIHFFKGFSVMRSNNLEESATIICNMAYKIVSNLKKGKTGYYSNVQNLDVSLNENISVENEMNEKKYCSVVKKVKKENITVDNIGEIMLCQIPGVSSLSAMAILKEYKTISNLIKKIQEDDTCLNHICTTDSNGKNRKLSKNVVLTIIKFLHN